MMSTCRAYARAGLAAETDLQKLLNYLNPLLNDDLPPEEFVTLVIGLLDPRYGAAQLIYGGHGPLLFYSSAEDVFHSFEAQGPPLGVIPRFTYGRPEIFKFDAGDMLVLVTDGFIEYNNAAGEEFGAGRVQDVVRAHRTEQPAESIDHLRSAVMAFAGGEPQLDDLTALIVKKAHAATS